MKFEIKSWITGKVLFEADTDSLRACIELAVSKGVSLNYAELNDAKLNGAELNYAELNYAKLNGAELNYAELNGAELNYAELNDAKLIRLDGLRYSVIASQTHVHIECKRWTIDEFRNGDVAQYANYGEIVNQYPIIIALLDAREEYWKKQKGEEG